MNEPQLLNIPNPFPFQRGRLRLLEPADAPVAAIRERLLDGTYGKPYIVDDGVQRHLHLGAGYIQSAMRIDEPDTLDLTYTQEMAGFLLFNREPQRIVLLGLGGGSLAKFCYRALPQADITAVEIDPHVIALRRHFAIPENDARFRVIEADGAEFMDCNREPEPIDVLLIDAFDARGVAHSLLGKGFLRNAHAALSASGVAVLNLAGATCRYDALIEGVREVFGQQTILVAVKDRRTFVLFAFKQPPLQPDWHELKQRALALQAIHGIAFPRLVKKFERAARNNLVKQLAAWWKSCRLRNDPDEEYDDETADEAADPATL